MTRTSRERHDFFISYAAPDEKWAEWIGWELERAGFSTFFQAWDFLPGQSISRLVDYATARARRTIAVLSPDYLGSDFTAAEWGAAFRSDPAGRDQRMLPVLVREVDLTPLLANTGYVRLTGLSEEQARHRLLQAARNERLKPATAPAFPGSDSRRRPYPPDLQAADRTRSSPVRITQLRERLHKAGVISHAREWLKADQLDSGGFGRSQRNLMRAMSRPELTEHEFLEGGIFSTYAALDAYRQDSPDELDFLTSDLAQKGLTYLVAHQGHAGGFGRYISSRSGLEIHQNMRHTAFAVLALNSLGGPPDAIARGISYLERRLPTSDWDDEASPSTAPAALIRLSAMGLLAPANGTEESLTNELISRAASTAFSPLWPPYAGYPQMVLDTGLSTILLLPRPTPRRLVPVVIRAISSLLETRRDRGIPFHPHAEFGDVGATGLTLSTIVERILVEPELSPTSRDRYLDIAEGLSEELISMWDDPRFWPYSYTATVQGVVRLGGSLD